MKENPMTHDPSDKHVDQTAFWAAYEALQGAGVGLAELRAEVSHLIAVEVVEQRALHGLGQMLVMSQNPAGRRASVRTITADLPETYSSVTTGALDIAIQAAAKAMWEKIG
jgi:hypothetical protein